MRDPAIDIRPAVRSDLSSVLALYAQPGYDDGKVLGDAQAETIFFRMAEYPFYRLYVALEGAEIVGTYTLLIMINIGHLGTPSAVVESVAVAPSRQGRGIGEAMMEHAIATAEKNGCYKLTLSSNLRRTGAHAFYNQLGFRQHGVSFVVDTMRGSSSSREAVNA